MSDIQQVIAVYGKGVRVWLADDIVGWISTSINFKEVDARFLRLSLIDDSGKDVQVEISLTKLQSGEEELPPLCNPIILEGIDDLTSLSHLHEPAILHNIRTRYERHSIYTYSGIALIACNPFQTVNIYSEDVIRAYSGRNRGELAPHLFAIAEDAYRCMLNENTNQTVIVSGESGAGKTVSAKFIMRYFASAEPDPMNPRRIKDNIKLSHIEEQILATNPILEAFGNAKTTRNDNSSRFGKYMEILFDHNINIVGARIRTYLLERSRLMFQSENERNYHIFYQLCSGAPSSERKELQLLDYSHFHYLNQGSCGAIGGVNDAAEFELTQKSLSLIGISIQLQWKIFQVLAGLLHLGNLQIGGNETLGASIDDEQEPFRLVTTLLDINPVDFKKWMTKRQIVTGRDKIISTMSPLQATVARDAVAKYIYANLFEWLIRVVNQSLCTDGVLKTVHSFIGVLDIYGFEHFVKNSFEQFCINYANEKLQQEFNKHVFKLEQEEYVREQINWQFIEFSDNQPCIELIEGRMGILSLLDEESRLPSGTDQTYATKLHQQFGTPAYKDYFAKPKFSNHEFTVKHYAHDVTYQAEGFLDKNKDTIQDELLNVLLATEFDFLQDVLPKPSDEPIVQQNTGRRSMGPGTKKSTLGSVFKSSLVNLMDTISITNVHYIRCIKPNEAKKPWLFDPMMVLSQLRACGVLETIRISCEGYPSRRTLEDFVNRFYLLTKSQHWCPQDTQTFCRTILNQVVTDSDAYQIGKTKVFFRAGQLAYLEKLRSERLYHLTVLIQKNLRRFLARKRYLRFRFQIVVVQSVIRRKFALRLLENMRRIKTAICIQKYWRAYRERRRYQEFRELIIMAQSYARRYSAQKLLQNMRQMKATVHIQRVYRGWLVRREYHKTINAIILVQAHLRRRLAMRDGGPLTIEAKPGSHFKKQSYRLESKVVTLTQELISQIDDNKMLSEKIFSTENQLNRWKEKYENAEQKNHELTEKLASSSEESKEYEALLKEKDSLLKILHDSYVAKEEDLNNSNQELSIAKKDLEKVKTASKTVENKKNPDDKMIFKLQEEVASLQAQLMVISRGHEVDTTTLPHHRFVSGNSTTAGSSPVLTPNASISMMLPSPDILEVENMYKAQEEYQLLTSTQNRTRNLPGVSVNTFTNHMRSNSLESGINKTVQEKCYKRMTLAAAPVERSYQPVFGHMSLPDIQSILISEGLFSEIETFLRSVAIPVRSQSRPTIGTHEILFPANIVNMCVAQLWDNGFGLELKRFLNKATFTIEKLVTGPERDFILPFWLSNTYYLLLSITETEKRYRKDGIPGLTRRNTDYVDPFRVIEKCKHDLEILITNIYNLYLQELEKQVGKLVIPAIVESQPLNEYFIQESGFFSKGSSSPAPSNQLLTEWLNELIDAMDYYYVSELLTSRLITELVNFVGASAFNHIIMRKDFCNWKRGTQISANIAAIEEWFKVHISPELPTMIHLERLKQATKLLMVLHQIRDVSTLFQICYLLNLGQVSKLVSIYSITEYDDPIGPQILDQVAKQSEGGERESLFLAAGDSQHTQIFPNLTLTAQYFPIRKYIPDWQRVHLLKIILEYSQTNDSQHSAIEP
ncbi:Myosin type-2 heavy chain 1 [Basidiobolus ranarum]|uniref:Myosin type-2 heavy chain 1 n=1 Tax=Basidiobolus ranarum TaxID=34480 RepID=A0ABR2X395_9FUNG